MKADVAAFFDADTFTVSYVVRDPATRHCAIIDSVLDFDPASGRTKHSAADLLVTHVKERQLTVDWVLETHVHADHLSAGDYLKRELGGQSAIGAHVTTVQDTFARIFNTGPDFTPDGRQFDRLFRDGETFAIGGLEARVIHTPGHTPACISYLIGDAVFVGDTLFMPDYGTARCDFPGGDAAQLYRSIHRLYALPPETRMFLCHDYKAPGRDEYRWETTVGAQRANNPHIRDGISETEFVAMRIAKDKTLSMPRLILPSVQVNMRAGMFPEPESNGVRYLKLPVNSF